MSTKLHSNRTSSPTHEAVPTLAPNSGLKRKRTTRETAPPPQPCHTAVLPPELPTFRPPSSQSLESIFSSCRQNGLRFSRSPRKWNARHLESLHCHFTLRSPPRKKKILRSSTQGVIRCAIRDIQAHSDLNDKRAAVEELLDVCFRANEVK